MSNEALEIATAAQMKDTSYNDDPTNQIDVDAILSSDPGDLDSSYGDHDEIEDDNEELYQDEVEELDEDNDISYNASTDDEDEDEEEDSDIASLRAQLNDMQQRFGNELEKITAERDKLLDVVLGNKSGDGPPEESTRDILEDLDLSFGVTAEQHFEIQDNPEALARFGEDVARKTAKAVLEVAQRNAEATVNETLQRNVQFSSQLEGWIKSNNEEMTKHGVREVVDSYIDQAYHANQLHLENLDDTLDKLKAHALNQAKKFRKAAPKAEMRRGTKKPPNLSPNSGRQGNRSTSRRTKKAKQGRDLGDLLNLDNFQNFNM